MQIRCGRSLLRSSTLIVLLALTLALALSCTREEPVLLNLKSSTSREGGAELLNLSFSLSTKESAIQVTVEASDQRSSWVVSARPAKDGVYTIGPLSMGVGVDLPVGEYLLMVMLDDGQRLQERFTVQRP